MEPSEINKTNIGSTPVPDPTRLTTEQLMVAIASLKELIFARLDSNAKALERIEHSFNVRLDGMREIDKAVQEILETRMAGSDKAIKLLQDISDGTFFKVDEKISALKEVHEEKFSSIQTQFKERDVRGEQSAKDSKVAVDAALQAAKEAGSEQNKSNALAQAKSEASFTKQIDGLSAFIASNVKGLDDKINDLKERFSSGQGVIKGEREQIVTRQASNANVIALASVIAGVVGAIIGATISFLK